MNRFTIIDHSYEDASQPTAITIPMKSHQLKMLKHCLALENGDIPYTVEATQDVTPLPFNKLISTTVGIIGNPVGTGKSLIIMALMGTQSPTPKHEYIDFNSVTRCYYKHTDMPAIDSNVLVVPHTIYKQWQKYLKDQTNLTTEYVNMVEHLNSLKYDKNVILVSANQYNLFADSVNKKHYLFNRIIFDEADSIHITNCAKINYKFCWFVTSSVNNLWEPNGGHLCTLNGVEIDPETKVSRTGTIVPAYHSHLVYCNAKYFASTGQYGFKLERKVSGIRHAGFIKKTFRDLSQCDYRTHIFLRNSDQLIQLSFNLPNPTYLSYVCKITKILNILENLIPLNIQQMICAGDIESAIKASDIEKTNDTNLISIICGQLYIDIQNKKVDLDAIHRRIFRDPTRKAEAIKNCERDIESLEQKIENVRIKIQESNVDPITFNDIETPTVIKCCNQVFDFESITIYITSTNSPKCPMCRSPINNDSLIIVTNEPEPTPITPAIEETVATEFNSLDHTKVEVLEHILSSVIQPDARVIIFSSYDNTFKTIGTLLDEMNIVYKLLKGHSSTIADILTWHNQPGAKPKVLFLNASNMGSGLNIHWTTDVIIYHKMDAELEMQIIGRAHRPPRTTTTAVHRILYETTEQ